MSGVPSFAPSLNSHGIYSKDDLREFLLEKSMFICLSWYVVPVVLIPSVVAGELAAYKAPAFASRLQQPRQLLINGIAKAYFAEGMLSAMMSSVSSV